MDYRFFLAVFKIVWIISVDLIIHQVLKLILEMNSSGAYTVRTRRGNIATQFLECPKRRGSIRSGNASNPIRQFRLPVAVILNQAMIGGTDSVSKGMSVKWGWCKCNSLLVNAFICRLNVKELRCTCQNKTCLLREYWSSMHRTHKVGFWPHPQ